MPGIGMYVSTMYAPDGVEYVPERVYWGAQLINRISQNPKMRGGGDPVHTGEPGGTTRTITKTSPGWLGGPLGPFSFSLAIVKTGIASPWSTNPTKESKNSRGHNNVL